MDTFNVSSPSEITGFSIEFSFCPVIRNITSYTTYLEGQLGKLKGDEIMVICLFKCFSKVASFGISGWMGGDPWS